LGEQSWVDENLALSEKEGDSIDSGQRQRGGKRRVSGKKMKDREDALIFKRGRQQSGVVDSAREAPPRPGSATIISSRTLGGKLANQKKEKRRVEGEPSST